MLAILARAVQDKWGHRTGHPALLCSVSSQYFFCLPYPAIMGAGEDAADEKRLSELEQEMAQIRARMAARQNQQASALTTLSAATITRTTQTHVGFLYFAKGLSQHADA